MKPGALFYQETERVSKKQAIDREAHTERDELWADQLRSAACCLLGAHDGLEGQSILKFRNGSNHLVIPKAISVDP
ncbi:hypothetical protein WJX79_008378 [Trebouxia sp. C0005]